LNAYEADLLKRGAPAASLTLARADARNRPIRLRSWQAATVLGDVTCALAAGLFASRFRFGDTARGSSYMLLAVVLPLVWVAALAALGSYDRRWITTGAEPFRRVFNAGLMLLAGAAIASFLLRAQLSREWVGVTALVLTPLTIAGRYAGRKWLHHLIGQGRSIHRVIVAGSTREVTSVVRHMQRAPYAGFSVLAVCHVDAGAHPAVESGVPVFDSDLEGLLPTAMALGADTIAIAGSSTLGEGGLRGLAWRLEGSSVQLIVAPSVSDFAGPRIVVRPVDGLPLLTIDQPDLAGIRRIAKDTIDRTLAAFMLLASSPLMLVVAIAIKLDDRGPILFKQARVGRDGRVFHIWKFRTMTVDAEHRLAELHEKNEHNGILFKIRRDPRVTPVGLFLRRHSIDELPQLINVLRGEMSLVGPRPPLPREVERFGDELRRRLLVKPGMTGLWQINGRTDMAWEEAVRLDLYYVENWSVALDLMVLWKTLAVVLHGRGGY
jgi:exopolysaccharide biosynthesis polyprenyl glycosylphosphotransferase